MYNNQMPPPNPMAHHAPPMGYGMQYPPQAFMGYPQQQAYPGPNDNFRGGRGIGRGRGGPMPYVPGYQQQGQQQFFGGRGGQQGAFRGRKRKPFHGGSLETQRQWERAHICCFFLQGQCKFSEGCRFSHEDDGKPCQFGEQCKAGHGNRVQKAPGASAEQGQQQQQQQVPQQQQ